MLNLLGCNQNNFLKLIKKMNYKVFKKDIDIYFKYMQSAKLTKKSIKKKYI